MAMRRFTVGLLATAAVAVSGIAFSADPVTPKQALLRGTTASTPSKAAPDPMVGRLIVKLRDGVSLRGPAGLREVEAATGIGLTSVRELAGGASLVSLGAAMPLSAAKGLAARLAQDPRVEYANPDVLFKRAAVSADPRYAEWQWNLFEPAAIFTGGLFNSSGRKSAQATGGANLPPAWDVAGGGSSGVVVAIIDTGIVNHPDLNGIEYPSPYVSAGRFVAGYDFISSDVGATNGITLNFVSNDGDGRDADPTDPGDWVTSAEASRYPLDCSEGAGDSSWHGSHMAGVAAATANNGAGIAGIASNVRVQPIRALGKCGGSLSDIEEAIRWAAGLSVPGVAPNATPARVISLSLGGIGECTPSMQAAVDAALASGAVVVAATGNESSIDLISPANCRGVIAVTAHTINGENADYSNIGPTTTISAPGGGSPFQLGAGGPTDDPNWVGYYVWSTVLFGTTTPFSTDAQGQSGAAYDGYIGTSVAAPHVAGTAALIKSLLPLASAQQVRAFLVNNARAFPAGSACATGGPFEGQCGAGLLDAGAAVGRAVLSAAPVIVSGPMDVTVREGQAVTLTVSAAGAANLAYQWRRNGVDIPGATGPSYTTPALGLGDSGTRYSVTVTNALGSVTSAPATITVVTGGGGGGGALPPLQWLGLLALLLAAQLRRRE